LCRSSRNSCASYQTCPSNGIAAKDLERYNGGGFVAVFDEKNVVTVALAVLGAQTSKEFNARFSKLKILK